jgi:hypothetical protein
MRRLILPLAAVAVFIFQALSADGLSPAEATQIEALISAVERMTDATFIRNGRPYDAAAAAEFLRRKWRLRGAEVRSAEDFIDQIASVSSTTGQPYLIRFGDGSEIPCSTVLRTELSKLRKSELSPDPP